MARTPLGRAIFADAKGNTLDVFDFSQKPKLPQEIMAVVNDKSQKKKAYSEKMHEALVKGKK